MKTLKMLLIAAGIFAISSAYSFTLLNMMVDKVSPNSSDNPIVLNQRPFHSINGFPNQISEREKDEIKGVELDEVVISAGQLNTSIYCIQKQLGYPQWPINERLEGLVLVSLVFDSNGQLAVRAVNSSNRELTNYVTKKLSQVHFNNCAVEVGKE
ncbi:MAG: hypothetical protein GXO89_12395 [Chlorobi bacterium]|nr:hypothetical protein [Chlorobiota bacterium]